ncbi:RbsD/FucU family protein [Diplocloster agilis]|uniref:Fucose operon FucU protein n=1 Tax=Diplocloster agilis TaxID=2850323 RepID=A0A949NIL0_9FIRM|nr:MULTISPECIES: RbsD/FucU domain-containing protein [Lachnospiraceae]MBU9738210.1 fucose operon FucU protein [Diplocloster agilis]MBU9744476.1 fucose operon FucU protein [Diplocloster agilis]MCU6735734.1 fucose operon FucU protein [Suonthocola fibrivorans]SCJ80951.1 L-fucose mutarotase [uncultured Clostridium sp.]
MLKRIPPILPAELMKHMMEMGHSDVLILADANFPAVTNAKRYIKADGVEIPELLEAILPFFPLDSYVPEPVKLMQHLPEEPTPRIWQQYQELIGKYDEEQAFHGFGYIDRLPFYEAARSAYVIVQTKTTARYANIMLQKGVI